MVTICLDFLPLPYPPLLVFTQIHKGSGFYLVKQVLQNITGTYRGLQVRMRLWVLFLSPSVPCLQDAILHLSCLLSKRSRVWAVPLIM